MKFCPIRFTFLLLAIYLCAQVGVWVFMEVSCALEFADELQCEDSLEPLTAVVTDTVEMLIAFIAGRLSSEDQVNAA